MLYFFLEQIVILKVKLKVNLFQVGQVEKNWQNTIYSKSPSVSIKALFATFRIWMSQKVKAVRVL